MTPRDKAKLIDKYNEEFLQIQVQGQKKTYDRYYQSVLGQVFNSKEKSNKEIKRIINDTPIKTNTFKITAYTSLVLSGVTNVIEKQNLDAEDKKLLVPIIAILAFYKRKPNLVARKTEIITRSILTGNKDMLNSRDKKILPMFKQYYNRNKKTLNTMLKKADKQIKISTKKIKSNLSKQIVKDLNKEINTKVKDKVIRGNQTIEIERKQTYQEVRGKIEKKYGKQINSRVDRILQTETKTMQEETKITQHQDMGYVNKKWNTQLDKKVRGSHKRLQGKVIKIDKKFRVGAGWGMYPADTNLPAKERINERCYLTYTKR